MNHHAASQQSVSKQVLVNKLVKNKLVNKIALFPELSIVVKDFLFYDRVSQVSRNVKNVLLEGLNMSFAPNARHYVFTEGYGILATTGEFVRYRHTGVQCIHSIGGLQFITCHKCGNYILSESSNHPSILCNCGIIDMIDDEIEEQIQAQNMQDEEDEEDEEQENIPPAWDNDNDEEYTENDEEEIMDVYQQYVAQSANFNNEYLAYSLLDSQIESENNIQDEEQAQEEQAQEEQAQEEQAQEQEEQDDEEFRVSNYFNQMESEYHDY